MVDEEQVAVGPVSGTIGEIGQALGWEVPRVWATGVQIFAGPEYVMFVLKEQTVVIAAEPEDPENPNRLLSRNVGSFVLPLSVAKEFQKIFNGLDLDAVNAVATAQS